MNLCPAVGHGRPGALSVDFVQLLPGSSRDRRCLRLHAGAVFQQCETLAEQGRYAHFWQCRQTARWQQERHDR